MSSLRALEIFLRLLCRPGVLGLRDKEREGLVDLPHPSGRGSSDPSQSHSYLSFILFTFVAHAQLQDSFRMIERGVH